MSIEESKAYFGNILENVKNIDNLKELCCDMVHFKQDEHPDWQQYIDAIENRAEFLLDVLELDSPIKEFVVAWAQAYIKGSDVRKSEILSDDNVYCQILSCEEISEQDRNIIRASKLSHYFFSGNYYEAEDLAQELCDQANLPLECIKTLMTYFTNTRRYDISEHLYNKCEEPELLNEQMEDCEKRKTGIKREYRPAKKERIELFSEFMKDCLEIEVKTGKSRIRREDYPLPEFITGMNFDSFVAYDVETSGLSRSFDYITEIGAIKVVNGEVADSKEFKFQELIRPYGRPKRIPDVVVEITGITNEMVENANTVDQVFNDFADFIGDSILVGYNNRAFDSVMLTRAGRYANRIITNKQLDLLPIAKKETCGCDYKLGTVAEEFGIKNPQAHRAYADALTTARLFFALKKAKYTVDEIMDILPDKDEEGK